MEWINVKDRLPEKDREVVVWNIGWKRAKLRMVGETILWHYEGEYRLSYDEPSHWIEIVPPKQLIKEATIEK